jgi:phosphate transport system ATP-binding protein
MAVILEVNDLSVSAQKQPIIQNISFDLQEGETAAIIGPSGCGKSTLLRSLNRILTDTDVSIDVTGRVVFEGKDIYAMKSSFEMWVLRQEMVYVTQTPFYFEDMSIVENVAAPMPIKLGMNKDQARRRAEELIEMVGLWDAVKDRLNASPKHLSAGQQQRLNIARAFSGNPRLLLLDEPTANIDPESGAKIEDILKMLVEELNTSILFVSHNLAQVKRMADTTMFMGYKRNGAATSAMWGEIIEMGSTQQLFDDPKETETKNYLSTLC